MSCVSIHLYNDILLTKENVSLISLELKTYNRKNVMFFLLYVFDFWYTYTWGGMMCNYLKWKWMVNFSFLFNAKTLSMTLLSTSQLHMIKGHVIQKWILEKYFLQKIDKDNKKWECLRASSLKNGNIFSYSLIFSYLLLNDLAPFFQHCFMYVLKWFFL